MVPPPAKPAHWARLSDYLGATVIAKVFPRKDVVAALRECDRLASRQQELSAEAMLYYVIALGLFRPASGQDLLRRIAPGFRLNRVSVPLEAVNSWSVSRARSRLGSRPFTCLRTRTVKPFATTDDRSAWYRGRRIMALDGLTLEVTSDARNRSEFAGSDTDESEAVSPQITVTLLVELGTSAAVDWQRGASPEPDSRRAAQLAARLPMQSLLLAGRQRVSTQLWAAASARQADIICTSSEDSEVEVGNILRDGSFLSEFAGLPVRVFDYREVESDGPNQRVITSLLDSVEAPAHELAQLHHAAWGRIEGGDEIKRHTLLHGSKLRSRKPDLVLQEVDGLMMAYYAVRRFLYEIARQSGTAPCQLSITGPVQVEAPAPSVSESTGVP